MVEGVALELLCRLLLTEGSNPSLSLPSPNLPILLITIDQIAMDTTIPTVRPFFDMDSLFLLVFFFFVRFKSDENNILQLTIHLFSNRPTYYLLFD